MFKDEPATPADLYPDQSIPFEHSISECNIDDLEVTGNWFPVFGDGSNDKNEGNVLQTNIGLSELWHAGVSKVSGSDYYCNQTMVKLPDENYISAGKLKHVYL